MSRNFHAWALPLSAFKAQFCWSKNCMLFAMLRFSCFIATMFINTVFYRGVEEEEEEGSSWNINKAQWRASHRQPLLLPFSFSFCFVFCIHHCPKKKTRNRAQFTIAPSAHHRPPSFPLPATPLSLLLLLRLLQALYCS